MDNYENIWGVENENNAESIFEVQFISGGIGQGSPFTNDFSKITATDFANNIIKNIFNPKLIAVGTNHHFGFKKEGDIY